MCGNPEKDQNSMITFQEEYRSELLKHFWRYVRYFWKRTAA